MSAHGDAVLVSRLVSKPLAQIVAFWRPGSHEWGWADEYADLMGRDREVTDRITARLDTEGWDFIDHIALDNHETGVWGGTTEHERRLIRREAS